MFGSATPRIVHLKGMNPEYEALLTDFEFGSTRLRPEHEAWLRKLGERLNQRDGILGPTKWDVHAVGYASQSGSDEANFAISRDRASSAWNFFEGLNNRPRQMQKNIHAMGEDHPRDPKHMDNALDRAVHFGVMRRQHVVPPKRRPVAPKPEPEVRVPKYIQVLKAVNEEAKHLISYRLQIVDAQETGVSIGKAVGLGYSTLRINFTVKNPRTHEKREFTFMGDGYGGGIGVPLPLDIMFTVGRGDEVIENIYESVDVWRHFVGPAKVEFGTDGEPFLDYSYYRFREHDLSVALKMPTQIQAPQVNIKFFEGRVRAGRLR